MVGEGLLAVLFSHMSQQKMVISSQPNIFGGVDYTSGHQYLGSINEGVLGMNILDSNNQVIGTITDNVMGGSQIAFTDGTTMTSMSGVLGENYYVGGDFIGYETENIFGGASFIGDNGAHLASGMDGVMGSTFHMSNLSGLESLPDFSSYSSGLLDSMDIVNSVYDFSSVNDVVDTVDVLGSFDLLSRFF